MNLNNKIESRPIKQINNAYTRRNGLENYWYEMIGVLNVGLKKKLVKHSVDKPDEGSYFTVSPTGDDGLPFPFKSGRPRRWRSMIYRHLVSQRFSDWNKGSPLSVNIQG